MNTCKYELNFEDQNYTFDTEEALNEFLLVNQDRVKQKMKGSRISASKVLSTNAKQEAINANIKIEDMLASINLAGGVDTDYNAENDEIEVNVRKNLKSEGFIAVNKHINQKEQIINGVDGISKKQIILAFNEDNYRKDIRRTYVKKILNLTGPYTEEQQLLVAEKFKEIENDREQTQILDDYTDKIFEDFEKTKLLGIATHGSIELFIKQLIQLGDVKLLTVENFINLNRKNVADLDMSDDAQNFLSTVVYNQMAGSVNKPGLVEKLHLSTQAFIYSELPIVYKDDDIKLIGIIDLLVIDNDGRAYLYDFKTSSKDLSEWSRSKDFRMRQQLGYYRQMLQAQGIRVTDVAYIPITLDTDIDFKNITTITQDPPQSVMNDLQGDSHYYGRIRHQIQSDISSDTMASDISDTQSLEDIDNFLQKSLNVNYKDKVSKRDLEKAFEVIWKQEKVSNALKQKKHQCWIGREMIYLPDDKQKQKALYIELELKEREKSLGGSIVSSVQDSIERYKVEREKETDLQKREQIPFVLSKNSTDQNTDSNADFNKLFGKYRGDEWAIMTNDTAKALGFIIFVNNISKTLDIISVSQENLQVKHDLPFGDSILGNKYSNNSGKVNNDKRLLKSNRGSVELMKIMAFINFNTPFFINKGYKIGALKTVNQYNIGFFESFETLKYNFAKLAEANGLKESYNLHNAPILTADPIETLMNTISNLEAAANSQKLGFKTDTSYSGFRKKVMESYKSYMSGDQIQEVTKNEIIKELTLELNRRVKEKQFNQLVNPTQADYFTKTIQDQINYYTGSYTPKFEEELENVTQWSNSIKNLPQELINATRRILNVSMENIKTKFLTYKELSNPAVNAFFDEAGYEKARRYTVGDHPKAFMSLIETTADGNKDPRFLLKDPFDMKNNLKPQQRKYLETILTVMNNTRGGEFTIKELSQGGDTTFRQIPLIKSKQLSLFTKGDYRKWFDQIVKETYNPVTELFGDTGEEANKKPQPFYEVSNFIKAQSSMDDKIRNTVLQEDGVEAFETDMEVVMDLFVVTYLRSDEFNQALPLIQQAKVQAIMDNVGVLNEVQPVVDFIDRHLKIQVKGERLISPKEMVWDKWTSSLRSVTSIVNLAFNPISLTRENLQAMYGASVRARVQAFGENTHTFKDFMWQYKTIIGESAKDVFSDTNIIESLNVINGMSNMNLGSMIDRTSTTKTGLPHFQSNFMMALNRAPEYMTRMGILLQELKHDDAWKAYSFKDGKLIYNWKQDGRFSTYAQFKGKEVPQTLKEKYITQRDHYTNMLAEWNKESSDKVYEDLPQAYTNKEVEQIKGYADSILGYYDPESKIQAQATLIGANFLHFKTWMVATKDKWLLTGQTSDVIGSFILLKDELGNQIYIKPDGTTTTEQSDEYTRAEVWQGKWNEGIMMSINRLLTGAKGGGFTEFIKNQKGGFKESQILWSNDAKIRSNIKMMLADLLTLLIMGLLAGLLFKKENKAFEFGGGKFGGGGAGQSWGEQILSAAVTSPQDLNPFKNAAGIFKPNGGWLFPSMSYLTKTAIGFEQVLFNDKSGLKWAQSTFGATRPLKYLVSEDNEQQ